MNVQIQPNIAQKFVVVESNDDIFLWGDPDAEFHKDIIQKMQNSGVSVIHIKGGGKLMAEKDRIYVWGKSSVYGEASFEETAGILKEKFPKHSIINKEPQE